MPVSRTTDLVTIHEYATSVALVPESGHFTRSDPAEGTPSPWPVTVSEWAFIPVFQRGIAWSREDVEALVSSSSEVLGTTVWGRFAWSVQPFTPEPTQANTSLNYHPQDAVYLTDGLQRFAIATTLLVTLDEHGVFGNGALATNLPRLSSSIARNAIQTFRFNHHVLANYPRTSLAKQYIDFLNDIRQWVDAEKNKPGWLSDVERFFLDRRVGVDIYTGFPGPAALASNFVGINTGGQQLGMVDIFRAHVIEDGLLGGWTPSEALSFDTDLSNVLVQTDYSTRLSPLVSQMGRLAMAKRPVKALPSLGSAAGPGLRSETTEFLERIEPYTEPNASPSPYDVGSVEEVLRCGKLPLSILAAWDVVGANAPWYVGNSSYIPAMDLLVFARSIYRLYLAGLEGRQTSTLVDLLEGKNVPSSLHDLADEISRIATSSALGSVHGIDEQVEQPWLAYLLEGIPKRRAARIFSACELPESFDVSGVLTSPRPTIFSPMLFGTRAADLQIDHLIPASSGGSSERAEETLKNFAPIPTALNRAIGTVPCDAKLLGGSGTTARYADLAAGTYAPARGAAPVPPHPYIEWLVNHHAPTLTSSQLNDKTALRGQVGEDRLAWLAERLLRRI